MYFLVSDEESAQTPSRKDEIDETQEFNARLFGCEFVRRCGRMLKLNQSCIATGQVLLHRFYFKKSLKKFDVKRMAATSIWLASKLEESPRKLRDVVNVLVRVEERMEGKKSSETVVLDVYSDRFEDIKEDLVRKERHMLKEFGFVIKIEHPHKFVLNYLQILSLAENKQLMQKALNHTNDALHTTICVRFNSETIACASIYLAAREMNVALPENPHQWWLLFDVVLEDIECVCDSLEILYKYIYIEYPPKYELLGELPPGDFEQPKGDGGKRKR